MNVPTFQGWCANGRIFKKFMLNKNDGKYTNRPKVIDRSRDFSLSLDFFVDFEKYLWAASTLRSMPGNDQPLVTSRQRDSGVLSMQDAYGSVAPVWAGNKWNACAGISELVFLSAFPFHAFLPPCSLLSLTLFPLLPPSSTASCSLWQALSFHRLLYQGLAIWGSRKLKGISVISALQMQTWLEYIGVSCIFPGTVNIDFGHISTGKMILFL